MPHFITKFAAPAFMAGFLFSMIFGSGNLAFAQTDASRPSQGLSISPFILERQMDKGQTLKESIEVTNTTDRTLPIDISLNDFAAQGDNGQQTFIEPGEGDQTYSLSKWITVSNNPKFVLKAGEKTQIDFSITAPQTAENGGHYGAVVFSFSGAPVEGSAVQVSQKIAAIILVKLGKSKEEGVISNFAAAHPLYEKGPIVFHTRFHNTGNVHVKPRGAITISNMFGKKVGTALVNQNGNNVIPNSERLFESTWQDKFAFGRYTASVELVYGDSGQVINAQTSFWVIPWKLVGGIAIGLFVIIYLLTFGIRKYNQWFMKKVLNQDATKKPKK
jgi:hypothetical protein